MGVLEHHISRGRIYDILTCPPCSPVVPYSLTERPDCANNYQGGTKGDAECASVEERHGECAVILSASLMLRSQVFEQGRRSIEEIHFYFKLETPQGTANAVMASSFSDPDAELLDNSYQTYWTAHRTDIL